LTFRRLSFHRDRMIPPPPPRPINSERDFVEFINGLNAQWVESAKRFSPQVLTDLLEKATLDVANWWEQLPLDAPALFGVSWAGERESEGWFDIGREFTELWHHQEQIRIAVGAPSLEDPRYLHAVLDVALRGLPHAFRDVAAESGQTVSVDVTGPAGGQWTLARASDRWELRGGTPESVATTRVRVSDQHAWRLLFNALKGSEASHALHIEGRFELARPLLTARSVVV